jgi:ADP-ribose pyrophosphatase YjhB (NUDIX family)
VIRRAAAPRQGQLSLPGGFIELHESWQHACARELREEAGVAVAPESIEGFGTRSTPDGYLLVFGIGPTLRSSDLAPFRPNREAEARLIISAPAELAFPLHTEMVQLFFASRR